MGKPPGNNSFIYDEEALRTMKWHALLWIRVMAAHQCHWKGFETLNSISLIFLIIFLLL